ncbi:hypothetical protein SLEP1_g22256 [Rubroshorea leprosula]|uniref:Uncharacterized protein n=1 Tax=Rubroshorea leprosula TaxID=152421 RepID=A0AAV5JKM3_9ROSI|nr:hypothetical protein SLEP1_g22256 [Rubroshorea leprosula]
MLLCELDKFRALCIVGSFHECTASVAPRIRVLGRDRETRPVYQHLKLKSPEPHQLEPLPELVFGGQMGFAVAVGWNQ